MNTIFFRDLSRGVPVFFALFLFSALFTLTYEPAKLPQARGTAPENWLPNAEYCKRLQKIKAISGRRKGYVFTHIINANTRSLKCLEKSRSNNLYCIQKLSLSLFS